MCLLSLTATHLHVSAKYKIGVEFRMIIYLSCRRGFRFKTTETLVVIAVAVCLKSLLSMSDLTNNISDQYKKGN